MKSGRGMAWLSWVGMGVLAWLLSWNPRPATPAAREPLLVYCAAGLKGPVERAASSFERETGVPVQMQFGGSGTLLANLKVSARGDLFVAADGSFIEAGRTNGLLEEVVPLARMTPVVVVRGSNPMGVTRVQDLMRPGVRVSMANPDATAIGSVVRGALARTGQWAALAGGATVFKPTVNDVANDVKIGAVDAGIVWDATAALYGELKAIRAPELAGVSSEVAVGVLRSCARPASALAFARYLGAKDRGLLELGRAGFEPVEGDAWAMRPEVVVYSGAVNRPALEPVLRDFEAREGVRVTRVYNGCGILTAQILSGQRPDAYMACDTSFMTTVSNLFGVATEVAETSLVMLVRKGNPAGIGELGDLARPGLRVGIAHEQQSALGALTARLLGSRGLMERVRPNVRVETPTGDLLVNQMRGGGLDAALVYEVNARSAGEFLDAVPVRDGLAVAVQPFAVSRGTGHGRLMERLRARLRSSEGRARFEEAGFKPR